MSLFDYQLSRHISSTDPTFASLIMSALRKADSFNYRALAKAFPEIEKEFVARYNGPGGLLESDGPN